MTRDSIVSWNFNLGVSVAGNWDPLGRDVCYFVDLIVKFCKLRQKWMIKLCNLRKSGDVFGFGGILKR